MAKTSKTVRSKQLLKCITYCGAIILFICILTANALADDLDDGIATEDISQSDEIKPDICINYIKRNAKSDALMTSDRKSKSTGGDHKAVQGGAYFEKGTTVKGDVIVIYEGKNNQNIAF